MRRSNASREVSADPYARAGETSDDGGESARDRAPSGLRGCRIVGAAALCSWRWRGFRQQPTASPRATRSPSSWPHPTRSSCWAATSPRTAGSTPRVRAGCCTESCSTTAASRPSRGLGRDSRDGVAEAEARERIAREMGVPPGSTLAVVGANTTREEAVLVGAALRPRGVRSILLVSGPFHLVRARAVFARQGLEVRTAPVEDVFLDAAEARESPRPGAGSGPGGRRMALLPAGRSVVTGARRGSAGACATWT